MISCYYFVRFNDYMYQQIAVFFIKNSADTKDSNDFLCVGTVLVQTIQFAFR